MRVISILLGLAVIAFLLWPSAIPFGFSGGWWASREAKAPVEPSSPTRPLADAAKAKPGPSEPSAPVALLPKTSGPKPAEPAGKADAQPPAALQDTKTTGAVAPQIETRVYRRVTVRDSGTLEADGAVIKLAGIAAREAEAACKDERGKTWPCGAAAKAALAKLIRARAVTCAVTKTGDRNVFNGEQSMFARCSVGGTDLAAWMVRQGWAEPNDANEAAFAEAAAAAKKERLGLWRAAD